MWHRDTKWANAVGKIVPQTFNLFLRKTENHHLWSMIKCNKMKCVFIYWAIIMCPAMFSVLWTQNWVSQASVPFSWRLSSSVCVISCFKSCPSLCDPMDYSQPGSSVHGVLQARTLEWAAISSSRGSSPPRDRMHIFCIGRRILYHWATWEAHSTRGVANIYDHNPEKWKSNPTVFWVHWLREHACGWFRLMSDRNQHNTVKQLSFN